MIASQILAQVANAPEVTTEPDPAWGFGLGGPLVAIGLLASWAALDLRGRMYERWKQPVDLAYSGLAERIADSLRELRGAIDSLLPPAANPLSVIADPGLVAPQAKRSVALIRIRTKLNGRFKRLLGICSALKYLTVGFTAAVVLATALYFVANEKRGLWLAASWLCVGMGFALVGAAAFYGILTTKLQAAVERSAAPTESAS